MSERGFRNGRGYSRNGYGDRRSGYGDRGYRRDGPSYGRKKMRRPRRQGFRLRTGTVVYILDILPYGHHPERKNQPPIPLVQVIETPGFKLFEMTYDRNADVKLQEKVVITNEPGCKLKEVKRRLNYHGLTPTAKQLLQPTIEMHINEDEAKYVEFLNTAQPITSKRHQLNLIPGIGEKLMWEILREREKKPFESFEDFHNRIKNIKDIRTLIAKRILNEIIDDEQKHYLFVQRDDRKKDKDKTKRGYRPYG